MKEISLAEGDFKAKDALEILTAYIHVEISLYKRKIELESDQVLIAHYADSIHRLQKILFEACEFIERKNGDIHLRSKLDLS
jgi:hypothetical protein